MGAAYSLDVGSLTTLTCGVHGCGIAFAIPSEIYNLRKDDGRTFWCPNGHEVSFIDSESKRLRRELERKQKELEWANQATRNAREECNLIERSRRSIRGAATKIKKRLAAGQCPYCEEKFANVAQHLRHAHPRPSPTTEGK